MVAHRRVPVLAAVLCTALVFSLVGACDKVPLLAPTGSIITLLPQTTTVSLNSSISIIATVIENGTAPAGTGTGTGTGTGGSTPSARPGNGTPVQNGTVITFTTTLGRIEPSEARTHNGQVSVQLLTGGTSGIAHITAYSGGASSSVDLKVGTAAVKTVTVTTIPQSLGASGGSVQVIATVTDDGGAALGGVPVTFATDKGSISPSTVNTDTSGQAVATLTTIATAKVTATAGTVSSTAVTVNVNTRSLSGFGTTTPNPSAGTPVTFTVTPASGANIVNVRVDFGDGFGTDLGPIQAATTTTHAYNSAGIFTATATARDATGDSGSLTTLVSVGSLQVTLSASPNPTVVDTPTTFLVGGLGTAQIDHFTWTWDDGTASFDTTSPQTVHAFKTKGTKTVRVDVFGLNGAKIGSAQISMSVL